jgi:hypothetical protein
MKKVIVLGAALLILGVGLFCSQGQGQPAQPNKLPPKITREMAELMNKKLDHAKQILEGVSRNDFNRIADNASDLITLSNREEWMVIKTPTYELFSNTFRRSAEDLIRHAKAKNADATSLAYIDLTMACVKCHRYVREVRDARLDPAPGELQPLVRREP